MRRKIIGYDRASLLDIAIAVGGSLECLFELAATNELSITDKIAIGDLYDVDNIGKVDSSTLKILNNEGVRPATEASAEDVAACPYGGIGFMGVETDFEVS